MKFLVLSLAVCASAALAGPRPATDTPKTTDRTQPTSNYYTIPPKVLQLRTGRLLARKHGQDWQLCKVKRLVWQEPLVPLEREGRMVGLIRETDAYDSQPPTEKASGLFVVFQTATASFSKLSDIKTNESVLASMETSDEILVRLEEVKPPAFNSLK